MNNTYKVLELCGVTIEGAVKELLAYKERGVLAKCDFNGTTLYSDTVTLDGAYTLITGKTKDDFYLGVKKRQEEWEENQRKREEVIPQATKFWVAEGKKYLAESRWGLWEEIIPIRLRDSYQGLELGQTLNIVKELNKGDLAKAKEIIEEQNHSGMSFSLVCAMVKEFSDRGAEFIDYVK